MENRIQHCPQSLKTENGKRKEENKQQKMKNGKQVQKYDRGTVNCITQA